MLDHPVRTAAVRTKWSADPMAPLLDDHAMARAVLDAMEAAAMRERLGTPLRVELWRMVATFFDDYFDGIHHPKEEELLLPLLGRAGFAGKGSPAMRMAQDHERMHPYRQHLQFAVTQRDPAALRTTVRAFTNLHRRHLLLEEAHVFPMARAVLGSVAQLDLLAAFHALDLEGAALRRSHARELVSAIHGLAIADDDDGGSDAGAD